jgi:dinuclear metal center YbgI/SA1388 family protein
MATVADLIAHLEEFAPLKTAAEWDNVGLLLGDRTAAVRRVLTCLTLAPEVADEAAAEDVQLIVTHHPILFRPVKRLTADDAEGRSLLTLARAGVAVYCPHTALDNAAEGINAGLARRLGLEDVRPLRARPAGGLCKVVVFVPEADVGGVSEALFAAGAGRIGKYRECSFRSGGTGTFFGGEGAKPTVGAAGRREEAVELRLEVVCAQKDVAAVVDALRKAHSYEEPAYDVYGLLPPASDGGEGRLGRLSGGQSLRDLAAATRAALACGPVQFVGEPDRVVGKVAVVCGSGASLLGEAVRAGADVLLTGEARFHDLLEARARGLALVLPGHYASERFGLEELASRLATVFPTLTVWASNREIDPVSWT